MTFDEKHYQEMKEFFNNNWENLTFAPYLPFCSSCGKVNPTYIGFIANSINCIISFAFCTVCLDHFTLKKNPKDCKRNQNINNPQ